MIALQGILLAVHLSRYITAALPQSHTDPSTNAVVDKGTFSNPSVNVRPKFRYWIPDASVAPEVVANDVRAAGDIGAAGLELLGYYLYGGPPSNGAGRGDSAPVDWATYGFGTPAWHDVFQAFAQAHKDNGLIMDFAIGPNQGTGVPAPEGSGGLSWDLVAFNVSVPTGESFDGVLPGWGTGTLQATITGRAIKSEYMTSLDPALPGDIPMNRTQITLSEASLTDVTDKVDANGHLSVTFDSNATGINNTIFAVYLIHSDFRAQDGPEDLGGPQTSARSVVQNGSWAADHFSALGAETITKFWEQYILVNGTRELLMDVGNYGWEDSVEIEANVFWTQNFSRLFEVDHGYSVNKWLPTLFHRNGHAKESNPPIWWITDAPDSGESRRADYRETARGIDVSKLAKQYHAYLTGLNEWAEQYLDLQFSAQISYNMPMDMLANIPSVDAPECESLDFSDLIDGYRQYSGPANLARRRIVSSECGAVRGEAFAQLLPELLWHVKRSYAGGVNQFVFHGFPYSGDYGNTTWPVFTTFNYQYSNMHGPSDPGWDFYRDQIEFVARNNFVVQTGVPKLDIAFWQKMTTYPGHIQLRTYEPTDLEEAGYTYEYVSPDNLELPSAIVENGILAPDAQGFKAMVVRANDSLTVEGVSRLLDFAHDGLPIIFSGGIPSSYLGTNNASALSGVNQSLEGLSSLTNVHITDSFEALAHTIASLGISPTTKINTNGSWFTLWRRDGTTNVDYFFIYNDAMEEPRGQGYTEGSIEFNVTGIPYEYDAWTGAQEQILTYTQTDNSTTISFKLAGNESTIVAFHPESLMNNSTHKGEYLTNISSGILKVTTANPTNGTNLVLQVGPASSPSSPQTYTTSSGKTTTVQPCGASTLTLSDWTLIVEHWDPPPDLSITTGTQKHNTTHHLPGGLASWQDIPGLQNVSGRGYYNTTFTWPLPLASSSASVSADADGAMIDFGYVVHTLRAWVNGHQLPPLDVTRPQADIKTFLVEGVNTVEAVVATPLGNVMRPIWYDLKTSGTGPGSPGAGGVPPPVVDYGLIADVRLVPYSEVMVMVEGG
ncbi:hypothetical protein H2202_004989 [Exophiala xenobiotica]|nr:hypothetical protein H2202_004989 [Exophiala xenobiotica]KAK5345965.1 hypothetical protein LTR61_010351 [Exophiala xenobiotica]KAK5477400.1 hypothetical protein LTR26_008535 [Exophiala xenobiotica]